MGRAARSALLVLLSVLLILAHTGGQAHADEPAPTGTGVRVRSVDPQILAAGTDLTLTGFVTNTSRERITAPVVRVWASLRQVGSRERIAQWSDPQADLDRGQQLIQVPLAAPVEPGARADFRVVVPAAVLPTSRTRFSVLPVTITVTDGADPQAATRERGRTLVATRPLTTAASVPLAVGVVVPLTLPADPELFSPTPTTRLEAWRRAIGPGSTVAGLLQRLQGRQVTWLVDPAILDPPGSTDPTLPPAEPDTTATPAPEATEQSPEPASPSSAPSSESTSPETAPSETDTSSVAALSATVGEQLRARAETQPTLVLPYADPDLLALLRTRGSATVRAQLHPVSARTARVSSQLALWPASGLTNAELNSLSRAWRRVHGDGGVRVLSSRQLGDGVRPNPNTAGRSLVDGSAVLAYDEALSRTAVADSETTGAERTQQALADTLAMYQADPRSSRSVAMVLPRSDQADPADIAGLLSALDSAPWLRTVPATGLAQGSDLPRAHVLTSRSPGPGTHRSPITAAGLRALAADRNRLRTTSTMLVEPDDVLTSWNANLDHLTSSRWRDNGAALRRTTQSLAESLRQIPQQVRVRPASVNVFSDQINLGVTVENRLQRSVRHLNLALQPRRRVVDISAQPVPIALAADSRSTVRIPVRAVASGRVLVDAMLSTPSGNALGEQDGQPTSLQLNVRPTGSWLYWVLGIVAGPILIIGLLRALRRGPRTAAELAPPTRSAATHPESDDD